MKIQIGDYGWEHYLILDDGKKLNGVIWADDETGEYEIYLRDEDGELIPDKSSQEFMTNVVSGKIEFVRR